MLESTKQKLADEIDRLTHELHFVLPNAIQKAVELGDLSENAEYTSAIERQQFVQARLHHLRLRMSELSRIDVKAMPVDRIGFGSKVKLTDLDTGVDVSYTITAGDYIDIDAGEISLASPIGQALLGKALGDEVSVQLPLGARRYRVIELTTLPQMLR